MQYINQIWQPLKLSSRNIRKELDSLRSQHPEICISDEYHNQLEEIFLLRNPQYRFNKDYLKEFEDFTIDHYSGKPQEQAGSWFYFPWLNTVIHILEENLYFEMRTGRNRNLITKEEQERYYNATIGIAGMSVGSHAALTISMTGGPKNLKLADPDTISGSNLNRIRTGIANVGTNKTMAVARLIYEINPYSNIKIFPKGVDDSVLEEFLGQDRPLDLLVEEMDNPYYKIKIREQAKLKKVPVIMATDNGDNIFVDIERFDIQPNLPVLNGIVDGMTAEAFKNLNPKDLPKTAAKIAGAQRATLRMQQSVLEVGKSLYSWPQLGTAANLCGTAIAYLARKLILKSSNIKSGRYEVNLEAIFEADYNSPEQKAFREQATAKFLKKIGLD